MVYLAKFEDGKIKEMVVTHRITIKAVVKEGSHEDLEKFIREEAEEWKKISIIESINFDENVIEIVVCVSKPHLFSEGMILAPAYPSKITIGMDSAYFIRSSKAIVDETNLYFSHGFKLPEGIKIKEIIPKIEVEQALFPEKGDEFIILY